MATNDRKQTVLGEEEQPSRAALNAMVGSVNDIVPVANTTERAAVASAVGATSTRPLYVFRADAQPGSEFEFTEDGTNWSVINRDNTRGRRTGPTDASGLLYITHGMSTTPSRVQLTEVYWNDTVNGVAKPTLGTVDATQIQVVWYRMDTGARLVTTDVVVEWVAFR